MHPNPAFRSDDRALYAALIEETGFAARTLEPKGFIYTTPGFTDEKIFLFEARDGRLVPLAGYQPVPTTPRLGPAIQFLVDVALVDGAGLTARGRAALGANA